MCAERSSPAAPKRRGSGSSCEMRRASSKSGGSEKTRRTGARRVDEKAEAAPLPAASGRVSIYPPRPAAGGETHAAFDARWTPAGPHREDWPLAFGSLIVALRSKYTWYPSLVRRPHRENRVSEAHRAQFSRWGPRCSRQFHDRLPAPQPAKTWISAPLAAPANGGSGYRDRLPRTESPSPARRPGCGTASPTRS